MASPFPEMDPWLELRWRDVHARLSIYERGRYDGTDFRRPLDPPLSPEDAAWAAELTRQNDKLG